MVKKNTIIAMSVTALTVLGLIGTVGYYGISNVFASDSGNHGSQLIQNIASTFGLDESAVKAVFDSTRTQERDLMLTQAVTEGTISEEQKNLIIAKEKETQTAINAIESQNLTDSEKQTQIKAVRDAERAWMTENNIPDGVMVGGGHGRGGMNGGREMMDSATRLENVTNQLTQAVSDGTITEAQKNLIIAKETEVQAKIEEINSTQLTESERQTQISAVLDAQKTWMTENNIPEGIMFGGHGGNRDMMR
jgi:hypothetical protein